MQLCSKSITDPFNKHNSEPAINCRPAFSILLTNYHLNPLQRLHSKEVLQNGTWFYSLPNFKATWIANRSITQEPSRHLFLSLGYEWDYNALNLTVPKALSVAPVYDLSPSPSHGFHKLCTTVSRHQARSREQLDKRQSLTRHQLSVQRLTLHEN